MASQELLGSGDDVSDHQGRAQGIDDVLVVGVENYAIHNFACSNKVSIGEQAVS